MKEIISFVVLHYQNSDVTIKSIETILSLKLDYEYYIVIVDNCSPNKSGYELNEKYKNIDNIKIIINDRNIGFAKANNVGYKYAKKVLGSNIIIVMNNDVFIKDKESVENIVSLSNIKKVHIIAPNIITLNEIHQNPMKLDKLSTKKIVKSYIRLRCMKIFYSIPYINEKIFKIEIKRRNIWKDKNLNNDNWKTEKYNIVPHGACVIYTKKWIDKEDIAFIPDTFMYLEEDILFDYILEKGYKTFYTPGVKVLHCEGASVEKVSNNSLKREIFITQNLIKSMKIILEKRLKYKGNRQ